MEVGDSIKTKKPYSRLSIFSSHLSSVQDVSESMDVVSLMDDSTPPQPCESTSPKIS
jgi:hypothetical protein